MEANIREKKITQTSIIGIAANVFLASFKAVIGLISGSVSIVLDAVNNLTDALSSIITIIGVKLAKRKPDKKHPFGYGRIEYFSAIIISLIIVFAGGTSLFESVQKIFSDEKPEFSVISVIILAAAVGVKIFLSILFKKRGKMYNSDALTASGTDAGMDAIISVATIIGALIILIFDFSLDGYIGVVISLFIIKAGVEILLDSLSRVMGSRADSETTKAIKETVKSVDGVLGAYDLILHNYGPDRAIGSIHIEIPDALTASDIHAITKKIQAKVLENFRIFLTVGVYAVDEEHKEQREKIHKTALTHEGVLGTHGIFFDDENKLISTDVVIDFTVKDRAQLSEALSKEIEGSFPGYKVNINFDANYSD